MERTHLNFLFPESNCHLADTIGSFDNPIKFRLSCFVYKCIELDYCLKRNIESPQPFDLVAMPEIIAVQPSTFSGHWFEANVSESRFVFRVLKMEDSLFIYVSEAEYECLNEMAVAMPMRGGSEILSTTIAGPILGCDSKELALKISKRLGKQVYLSCNVAADRMVRPLLEQRLVEEINRHPECF